MTAPGVIASQQENAVPLPDWLPANTVAWFDAADPSTVDSYAAMGGVSTWRSKVGGYALLQQGMGSSVMYGTTTQNGLPVVTFDGTGYMSQRAGAAWNASNCAIIGVAQTRPGQSKTWCGFGGYGSGISLTHTGENNSGWGLLVGYVEWWLPAASVANLYHLQTVTVAANSATLRSNRTVIGTKAIAPNPAINHLHIGGDYLAAGSMTPCDVAEIVYISGSWTQAEIDGVENALRTKWATA